MTRNSFVVLAVAAALMVSSPSGSGAAATGTQLEVKEFQVPGRGLISGVPLDIDGDGDLDFLGVPFGEGTETKDTSDDKPAPVVLMLNDGGVFRFGKKSVRKLASMNVGSSNVAAADFNGDGIVDVFIGDGGVDLPPFPGAQNRLALGNKRGKLIDKTRKLYPKYIEFTHGIAIGDIDGDGSPDIFEANVGCCGDGPSPGMSLFVNNGKGKFSVGDGRLHAALENDAELTGGEFQSAAFLDADMDGDLDLALGWGGGAGSRFTDGPPGDGVTDELLLNDGAGFFSWTPAGTMPPRRTPDFASTHHIIVEDMNGDGWPDLVQNQSPLDPGIPLGVQILLSNRDGTFRDGSKKLPRTRAPDLLRVADITGDGLPDILGTGDPDLVFWVNRGNGKFKNTALPFDDGQAAVNLLGAEATAYPADYDGDGDVDIVFISNTRLFFAENVSS